MKIAMLLIPNSKMGGIYTVHQNLKSGLEKLGHDVTDFYLSDNNKRPTVPGDNTKNCKWTYCAGRALGMMAAFVQATVSTLRKFDAVVYSTPAPSLNRAFSDRSWMRIFQGLQGHTKQIVLWHDPFWQKYYPWVQEVFDCMDVVAAIQSKAFDTLPAGLLDKAFICNHPLDLKGLSEHSTVKEDLIISPHQFKSWKRIDLLVRAVPAIAKAGCSVEVFNTGIEYYYMAGSIDKRKAKYKQNGKWIWDTAIKSGMQYRGTVPFAEIDSAFRRQKCVADLSVGELGTRKESNYRSINYSVLECMKFGGVPVCRGYSVLPPFTERSFLLADETDLVTSVASECVRAVRDWATPSMQRLRANNREVLRQYYEASSVAASIIERI